MTDKDNPVAPWKPGSTAPKDGTHILGHYKGFGPYVVAYDPDDGWQDTAGDRDMREPDFWTELPPWAGEA